VKFPFSLFLGFRYLRPKRTFVSLITGISVFGVVLGVFSLTVVIAVMTGFNVKMRESILGSEPHLVLKRPQERAIDPWVDVLDRVAAEEGVTDAQPFARGQAILDYGNKVLVVEVIGLDPPLRGGEEETTPVFAKLRDLIPPARYRDFGTLDLGGDSVVVGRFLADGMGLGVGDTVVLHSMANGRELLDSQNENREPRNLIVPAEVTVTGIYDSGRPEVDGKQIYVPLELAQRLYDLGGGITGIQLEVAEPYRVRKLQNRLRERIGEEEFRLVSWIDRNRALFDAVALERLNMYVLLFMIMVVAGFCITNTMITVTTQKRSEIGLMKAVGGPKSQIVGAFLGQGILVGLFGTVAGLVLAFLLLLFRKGVARMIAFISGQDLFSSQEMLMLYDLPAKITVVDIAVITGGAFLSCALSSLLPAYLAARVDAAQALREEVMV